MDKFWQRVDALLTNGQTLKWLCKELDINYRSILNLRTSKKLPSLEIGFEIAQILGTSLEFLLTGNEPFFEPEENPQPVESLSIEAALESLVLNVLKKHNLS